MLPNQTQQLAFEQQITKNNILVWQTIAARTAAERLHVIFPNLKFYKEEFVNHELGYLKPILESELGSFLLSHCPNTASIRSLWITEVIALLKLLIGTTEILHIPGGVPFKNIILPSSDGRAYRLTHNVNYVPNSELPPIFRYYIEHLIPEVKNREKVYAYLCYLLHEDKDIQQMLILVGDKKVGKSLMLNLIGNCLIALIGMRYEQINKDRASQVGMIDKFAVIFDEIADLKLNSNMGEQLKEWASSRYITVRGMYRSVEDKVPFYARFILSCNRLPYSEYVESAFYDRICLIECKKSYEGQPDPSFIEKILGVKDAIWSWVYDHYKDKYTTILGVRSNLTKEEYICNVNALDHFMSRIEPSDDNYIEFSKLYDSYTADALDDAISKVEFGKSLHKKGFEHGPKEGKTVYFVRFFEQT